ncbi:MAG: ribonuclease H-like domain-containing protein [Myxococcales bacterium]|nr:ribonuclease H-like domain-containing protein [Myxococcales bacterium]
MSQARLEPVHVDSLAAVEGAPGELLTAFAWVRRVSPGRTRGGKPFLDLELVDRSCAVAGKIWEDAGAAMHAAGDLERGAPVKLLFRVDRYQGALQLNIRGLRAIGDDEPGYDPIAVFGDGHARVASSLCRALVFDIETVPAVDREAAPASVTRAIERHAERFDGDVDMVMGLSPLLGKVVSLAYGEGDSDGDAEVTALVVPPADHDERRQADYPAWMKPVSEVELLRTFWTLAEHAEVVITYNGRGFDVPFLVARSLVHQVPARVDLLGNPYALRPHLDLYRVLTQGRAAGPMTLEIVCWALGIESPKDAMDGSQVAPAYARGEIESIAEYNRRDVEATTALYQRVREQLLRFRDDW